MIEFRERNFSKPEEMLNAGKKFIADNGGVGQIVKKLGGKLKQGATPVSVAALGISTGNLINNSIRRDQDRVFQEKQVEATNRLTKALNADTKSREVQNASNGYRNSIKDMAKYSQSDTGIPDQKEVKKRIKAIFKPRTKKNNN